MKLPINIRSFFAEGKLRQFTGLFSANLLGIPLSFVTNIILTSYLGAVLFGDFQFIYSIFNTANILLNLGIFYAANRALVLCSDKEKSREYYGTIIFTILFVSILMSIGVLVYSLLDLNVIGKGMDRYLIVLLPFSAVFMMDQCFETILQADNRIRLLSYARLLPKIVLLTGAILAYFVVKDSVEDKLMLILGIYIFSLLSVYICVYAGLKPKFSNIGRRFKDLFLYEKTYGFDIYLGAICAVGFTQISDILISYFGADNSGLGFYRLGVQFCAPLSFIPLTLANTYFKDFSNSERIKPRLMKISIFLSFGTMLLLWIAVPLILKWFFRPEFFQVAPICMITSIGVILYGLADFVNRFIAAKGMGKTLRNISLILGPCVLLFSILLIPKFGAYGAAIAKILSGATYFSIILFSYLKAVNTKKDHC